MVLFGVFCGLSLQNVLPPSSQVTRKAITAGPVPSVGLGVRVYVLGLRVQG